MSEIALKVKAIIVENLGVDADEVRNEANFVNDLGADSLDVIELIMTLEENFSLEIPDSEANKINTVGDAIEFVTSNVK